jgi:metal-responsive CopG/Arc/MetJ family transcriptional regulator
MKTLKDPYFDRDLKPHSITLTEADIKRLDKIMERGNLKNRSAAIRACIQYTYYQHDLNLDG